MITFAVTMYTIASRLCGIGKGVRSLEVLRAITGIFAASVIPVSLAIIGDAFLIEERQQTMGTFMGISYLGQGLSMVVGGSIAFFFSWRCVFVAAALLSIIPVALLIINYSNPPSNKNGNGEFFKRYIRLLSSSKNLFVYIIIALEGTFIVGRFSFLGSYIVKIYH